ncbi:MAG: hypothetical protein HW380_3404 [Magnetococcales bacterium]|nr:hypothetical protein [Magnetococcales bacterium]HIJ83168.1 PilZ domain-containing protein [Magnetococcales bacterium]
MNDSSANNILNYQRISKRLDNREPAILKQKKENIPVELLDLGIAGFGLNCMIELNIGDVVELEVSGESGLDVYRCKVVFCRPNDRSFRIGLEIIEQEPEIVFLSPDE